MQSVECQLNHLGLFGGLFKEDSFQNWTFIPNGIQIISWKFP